MNEKYDELIKQCSMEYGKMLEEYVIKNNLDSAFDIIRVDNKIKRNLMSGGINYVKLSFIVIEIYILILLIILAKFMEFDSPQNMLVILIIILSMLEIGFVFSKSIYKKRKIIIKEKTNKSLLEFEVIKTCKKIDGIVYDLKLETEDKVYIMGSWRFLYRKRLINSTEKDVLESLYFIRNKIMHSKEIDFDLKFIEKTINSSLEIINKLEKLIK